MRRTRSVAARRERGATLIELMVALVVLAIGVLAAAKLFPAGDRAQTRARLRTEGNYYAQDQLETLMHTTWSDPALSVGRHPGATTYDDLGSGAWHRFYTVSQMTGDLTYLKRVDVNVFWGKAAPETITTSTYVRR